MSAQKLETLETSVFSCMDWMHLNAKLTSRLTSNVYGLTDLTCETDGLYASYQTT